MLHRISFNDAPSPARLSGFSGLSGQNSSGVTPPPSDSSHGSSHDFHGSSHGSSHGFALVIALGLMAFVLLLLLSVSTLLRVESQVASQSIEQTKARANAELALMIALGELQEAAGPDQRATGTADLAARSMAGDRLAPGSAPANDDPLNIGSRGLEALAGGARFWTGVWSNRNDPEDSYTEPPSPQLLQWLVSGNESTLDFKPNLSADWSSLQNMRLNLGANPAGIDKAVVLVHGNSAGFDDQSPTVLQNFGLSAPDPADLETAEDRYVIAPLLSLDDGGVTTGRYAYWVGDEGVKARYNLTDPLEGSSNPSDERLRGRVAQRVAAEMATAAEESQPAAATPTTPLSTTPDYAYDDYPLPGEDDSYKLPRISTNAQMEVLREEAEWPRLDRRFHALSLHSRGVLSDSLSGGLKQDLSLALEENSVFNQMFPDAEILPGTVSPTTGPLWQTIQQFYDLAKRTDATINLDDVIPGSGGPAPVITEIRLFFGIHPNILTSTWHVRMNIVVGLGNPYTVPLETSGLHLAFDQLGQNPSDPGNYFDFMRRNIYNDYDGWYVWAIDGEEYDVDDYVPAGQTNPNLNWITGGNADTGLSSVTDLRIDSFKVMNGPSENPPPTSPWTLNGSDTAFAIQATTWQPGELKLFAISNSNQLLIDATGQTVDLSEILNSSPTSNYFSLETNVSLPPPEDTPTEYAAWLHFHENKAGWYGSGPLGFALSLFQTSASPVNSEDPAPLTRVDIQSFYAGWPIFPEEYQINPAFNEPIPAGVIDLSYRLPFDGDRWRGNYFTRRPYPFRPFADNNLRARFQLPSPMVTDNATLWTFFPFAGDRRNDPSHFTQNHDGDWSWGGHYHGGNPESAESGAEDTNWPGFTSFNLPWRSSAEEPALLSLGELQHVDLTANDDALSIGFQPGAAVGNSFYAPLLHRELTVQTRTADSYSPSRQMRFFDISYLLNTALFDRYFFSSYTGGALPDTLPNSRMSITNREDFSNTQSGEAPGTGPASSLLVEGAFNVNSTNPEAWASVLASTVRVPIPDDPDNLVIGSAFPRSLNQPDGANLAHLGTDQDTYSGYRRLTDGEIRKLAWEMVRQVRQRGPFLSLAQFVNRTLVAADTSPLELPTSMGLSGPLQAAIDATAINEMPGYPDHYLTTSDSRNAGLNNDFWPDYQHDFPALQANNPPHGSRLTGIPGYLTQADILQVIAPTLTTRSDTFRIRAYGESSSRVDGEPLARAWCEAIVQRRPEFVDAAADPAGTPIDNLSSPSNTRFGRKFEIVGFRWLSEDEI